MILDSSIVLHAFNDLGVNDRADVWTTERRYKTKYV